MTIWISPQESRFVDSILSFLLSWYLLYILSHYNDQGTCLCQIRKTEKIVFPTIFGQNNFSNFLVRRVVLHGSRWLKLLLDWNPSPIPLWRKGNIQTSREELAKKDILLHVSPEPTHWLHKLIVILSGSELSAERWWFSCEREKSVEISKKYSNCHLYFDTK